MPRPDRRTTFFSNKMRPFLMLASLTISAGAPAQSTTQGGRVNGPIVSLPATNSSPTTVTATKRNRAQKNAAVAREKAEPTPLKTSAAFTPAETKTIQQKTQRKFGGDSARGLTGIPLSTPVGVIDSSRITTSTMSHTTPQMMAIPTISSATPMPAFD